MRLLASLLILIASAPAQEMADDLMSRARTLARELERVEDSRLAVRGLARLGRITCRLDPETARFVFETGAARQRKEQLGGSLPAWEELLQSARACSAPFAASLEASVEIRRPSIPALEREIRTALEQTDDEESDAASRLEPATPYFRELGRQGREDFVRALLRLRARQEQRADEMFLDTLRYLGIDPAGTIGAMFVLGNYCYGPSGARDGIMPLEVDDYLAYDLSARRADSSPDVESSYLSSVARVFELENRDIRHFLLARQLYRRALEFSAELARSFAAVARQGGQLPAENATSPEQLLPTSPLAVYERHWAAGRFDQARDAASRLPISPAKQQLADLAAFGEVRDRLRRGDLDQAFALAGNITPGTKQAVAYLGMAAVALAAKDRWRAGELLKLVASQIGSLRPAERAAVCMLHAHLQAGLTPEPAYLSLSQAVAAWNDVRGGAGDSKIRAGVTGFIERVEAGGIRRQFRLDMPGLGGYGFAEVLPAFAGDLDRADSLLAGIRNPERRLDARLASFGARARPVPSAR